MKKTEKVLIFVASIVFRLAKDMEADEEIALQMDIMKANSFDKSEDFSLDAFVSVAIKKAVKQLYVAARKECLNEEEFYDLHQKIIGLVGSLHSAKSNGEREPSLNNFSLN
jgi:hypothetical protein